MQTFELLWGEMASVVVGGVGGVTTRRQKGKRRRDQNLISFTARAQCRGLQWLQCKGFLAFHQSFTRGQVFLSLSKDVQREERSNQ